MKLSTGQYLSQEQWELTAGLQLGTDKIPVIFILIPQISVLYIFCVTRRCADSNIPYNESEVRLPNLNVLSIYLCMYMLILQSKTQFSTC